MALLLTAGLALANGAGTSFSVQHGAAIEMRHCGYQMYGTTKVRRYRIASFVVFVGIVFGSNVFGPAASNLTPLPTAYFVTVPAY